MHMKHAIPSLVLALTLLASAPARAGDAEPFSAASHTVSGPSRSDTSPTSASASSVPQTDSSWSAAPTAAGGFAASGTYRDKDGRGFFDFYYTPYGDDMKGGGGSFAFESETDNPIEFGFRFGGLYTSATKDDFDMWLGGMTIDFYGVGRLTDDFSLYAGVGLFVFEMEMEVPYQDRRTHAMSKQDAEGDGTFFSGYAGARLRIADALSIFCEYRYENGDVEMTLSKSHTGMDAKDVGGGRVVFGAGFAF